MIQLHDLLIGYGGRNLDLPGISGQFSYGSMTAVLGANGVGKSTFLKTLAGFLPPISGKLKFNVCRRPNISYFPQRANFDYQFPLTVFDVVAMGCWPNIGLLGKVNEKKRNVIYESLESLNLGGMLKKNISMLSVGQFQRMLFARLLVQQASLVLLDEPFSNVDRQTCNLMLSVINKLHSKGVTIVVVTHDHSIVTKYFPCRLFLSQQINIWS